MAQFEQKPNTGSIFKNDTKGNDKAPAYKGTVNVDGKVLEIALWVKDKKDGEKYFSAKIQEPKPKSNTGWTPPKEKTEKTFTKEPEPDLPF